MRALIGAMSAWTYLEAAISPRDGAARIAAADQGLSAARRDVGDGAVIDHQFGTTDVLIVMPVSAINVRYVEHFGADADRHAA